MKTYTVKVTQVVEVDVDESHFTDEVMEGFQRHFCPFSSIEDHVKHIAQMEARSLIGFDTFVEGYGLLKELGISAHVKEQWEEIE